MTCASTSLRISVIARCAATPSTCEFRNDVAALTRVAAPAAIASLGSKSQLCFVMTSSIRYFVVVGRTKSAEPADDHQHEAERQALAVLPDERTGFLPGALRHGFLLRLGLVHVAMITRGARTAGRPNGGGRGRNGGKGGTGRKVVEVRVSFAEPLIQLLRTFHRSVTTNCRPSSIEAGRRSLG